jgi:hypothetical protein
MGDGLAVALARPATELGPRPATELRPMTSSHFDMK